MKIFFAPEIGRSDKSISISSWCFVPPVNESTELNDSKSLSFSDDLLFDTLLFCCWDSSSGDSSIDDKLSNDDSLEGEFSGVCSTLDDAGAVSTGFSDFFSDSGLTLSIDDKLSRDESSALSDLLFDFVGSGGTSVAGVIDV